MVLQWCYRYCQFIFFSLIIKFCNMFLVLVWIMYYLILQCGNLLDDVIFMIIIFDMVLVVIIVFYLGCIEELFGIVFCFLKIKYV